MAYLFDDVATEYCEYALGSTPTIVPPVTLSCWFNPDTVALAQHTMVSFCDSGTTSSFRLRQVAARLYGTVQDQSGNAANAVATIDTTANVWHHALMVVSTTASRTIYLDGGNSHNETTSVPTGHPSNRISVGKLSNSTPGYYFSGMVAEVAIWLGTLDAGQIAALAAGYSPALIRPNVLYFYAPLVRELTERFGKTLTAYNTPTVADHPRVLNPVRINLGESTYVAPAAGQPTALRDWVRHTGRPWRPQRGL